MDNESDSQHSDSQLKATSVLGAILGRILFPALITVGGIMIAFILFKTRPVTETAPPTRTARLVETIAIAPSTYQVKIEAMGLVKAKNLVEVKSRVSGEITEVFDGMIPGNTCPAGTILYKVDPADFALSLASQESNLQQAQANLMIEKGQQQIAKTDYEMTGNTALQEDELDLVLRKPQLLQAEATAKSARASYDAAKLNLDRTEIKTPFDALVLSRSASLGSVITPSTVLATIADSSAFWVELTIPVRDTKWIGLSGNMDLHATPIEVQLVDQLAWGKKQMRLGQVVGLSREVESDSRMAKVVVEVGDPLALLPANQHKPSLLLGSFVRGLILGKELEEVIVINRDYLRQGDILWSIDAQNRLVFNEVEVLYNGTENVVIKNQFTPGTRIVTSNLSVPVEGMLVRYEGGPVVDAASGIQNKNGNGPEKGTQAAATTK